MLKKLIIVGLLLSVVDPLLLYLIWGRMSNMQLILLLVIFPLTISSLSRWATRQNPSLGGISLSLVARLLAWAPGIISKLLSILLIIPPIQMLIARWATARFLQAVDGGQVRMMG